MIINAVRISKGLPRNWSAKDSSAALTTLIDANKDSKRMKENTISLFMFKHQRNYVMLTFCI